MTRAKAEAYGRDAAKNGVLERDMLWELRRLVPRKGYNEASPTPPRGDAGPRAGHGADACSILKIHTRGKSSSLSTNSIASGFV